MFTAAGHSFATTEHGVRCTVCGADWMFVRSATKEDIGSVGFAHTGGLLQLELVDIVNARRAEETVIWDAVCDLADGTPW